MEIDSEQRWSSGVPLLESGFAACQAGLRQQLSNTWSVGGAHLKLLGVEAPDTGRLLAT
jgi:hypothetical protein